MLPIITNIFKTAPHIERLPDDTIKRRYPWFRWSILESTFIGYATFYLVRNNLSPVIKSIENSLFYDHSMTGNIIAVTGLSYGIGKFLMGSISDRSNPRRFMPAGLILTAILNFTFGGISNYPLHLAIWGLNGFIQGMGWPPCGRSIGHWFSVRERGKIFAIWNIAHNVGGGLAGIISAWAATRWGWQYAFYIPGVLACFGAVYLLIRLKDTPQSVGLPPIEEYRNDYPPNRNVVRERELSNRELFIDYILKNKYLWFFAIANFFVYIARYCMLDWGPTYLQEIKGATQNQGGQATAVLEWAGIPSTIVIGWLSDKVGGRRGMVSLLCMVPVLAAFAGLRYNPPGNLWLDLAFFGVVGCFVYPPVMLLGVSALDMTSKKAVGAAAGFVGLFGYLGRATQAKGIGWVAKNLGWEEVFILIISSTTLSIIFLAFTWKIKPRG